jgi:hypothetical protein
MMLGWREMDLALGCARYMPPLQGLGFLLDRLPRALPWAITLCPFGAEDWCPVVAEDRCLVVAEDRCVEVICFQPQRGDRRKPRATPWVRKRIRYASPEGAV